MGLSGLRPKEDRAGFEDKSELFHMYDGTYQNADTRPGKTDSLEMLWKIDSNFMKPDTSVLAWDPAVTYRFREEWGPDGAGNCLVRTFRDGVRIMDMSEPGEWAPAGGSTS